MEESKKHNNVSADKDSVSVNPAQETESDPELDDLLDSALEDFNKPIPAHSQQTTATELPEQQALKEVSNHGASSSVPPSQDAMFNEVFNMGAQKQLEDMMKAFMGQDPNMMQNIEKLAEAAGKSDDTEEGKKQFEQTLQDTLGNLAQNAEQIQGDLPGDDMTKLLENLNMGDLGDNGGDEDGLEDINSFMPMMQGMMKSLLSKEVLYPSLKDISEKFPKWLEDNKDKTSEKQFENYNKQYEYMKKICVEYEQEKGSDTDSVKKERFEKVLECMQNMQELGYPPKDLVGDMPTLEGAFGGLANLAPGSPQQCSLM